jgi:hypothetical protein
VREEGDLRFCPTDRPAESAAADRRGMRWVSGTARDRQALQITRKAAFCIFAWPAGEFFGSLPGRKFDRGMFFRCFHICSLSEINLILEEKLICHIRKIYPLSVILFTHKE